MGASSRNGLGAAEAVEPCGIQAEPAMSGAGWRTDKLSFDEQPIYQFVLLEGYQEHSGQTWHRRWAGTATIAKDGPLTFSRFGYRASDIDRIQEDGDMIVVTRVVGWMPATWPRWDFDSADAQGDPS